jgi:predicted aldo/keto reductase-like oxidoreductase
MISARQFGDFGPMLPILGLGGEVVFTHGTYEQAQAVFHAAIKGGVRYIDTAHDYENSQERFGRLFKEVPDVDLFVATKCAPRDRDAFLRHFDENVELLGRFPDVLHVHHIEHGEQQTVLKKGGALEAALWLKEQGACKYVGVTAHDAPDTLWEVVRWGAGIDVTMVALNVADTRFLEHYIPYCRSKGIAVVGMKVMGRGKLVKPDVPGVRTGADALRFTLSCPVDLAIVGFSWPEEVEECVGVANDFKPLTAAQMRDMVDGVQWRQTDTWFYREELPWQGVPDMSPRRV